MLEEDIRAEDTVEEPAGWGGNGRDTVQVETGRGNAISVSVGVPFSATMEQLAEEAHYGGYYRVFLNGSELISPEEAPDIIEAGMRIAITSYDKVG